MANQKSRLKLTIERHLGRKGLLKQKAFIQDAISRSGRYFRKKNSRKYRLRRLELQIEDLEKQLREVA